MKKRDEQGFWGYLARETLSAITLGWDLAVPIFGGVIIGYLIDRWLGTRPVFTIGLLVFGIATGYYNVARFIRRLDAKDRAQRNSHRHQRKDK
ncbi:MAG: AtpZ/AtpI family protein [Anaerolineae bacterium]